MIATSFGDSIIDQAKAMIEGQPCEIAIPPDAIARGILCN